MNKDYNMRELMRIADELQALKAQLISERAANELRVNRQTVLQAQLDDTTSQLLSLTQENERRGKLISNWRAWHDNGQPVEIGERLCEESRQALNPNPESEAGE